MRQFGAQAGGVMVAFDGEHLILEASVTPATALLEELQGHKAGIVALLRPGIDGWTAADWLAFQRERVETAEIEAGLARPQAEERAFACCVAEWLRHHPVSSRDEMDSSRPRGWRRRAPRVRASRRLAVAGEVGAVLCFDARGSRATDAVAKIPDLA